MDINQRMYHLLEWPDHPKKQDKDKAEQAAKDKQQEENK